jgi:hypothetical protein
MQTVRPILPVPDQLMESFRGTEQITSIFERDGALTAEGVLSVGVGSCNAN